MALFRPFIYVDIPVSQMNGIKGINSMNMMSSVTAMNGPNNDNSGLDFGFCILLGLLSIHNVIKAVFEASFIWLILQQVLGGYFKRIIA